MWYYANDIYSNVISGNKVLHCEVCHIEKKQTVVLSNMPQLQPEYSITWPSMNLFSALSKHVSCSPTCGETIEVNRIHTMEVLSGDLRTLDILAFSMVHSGLLSW